MPVSIIRRRRLLQAVTVAVALAVSWGLFASDHSRSKTLPAVDNAKWREECAGCHMLYHPSLLPERSARKLMAGLARHFGADASLDAATQQEITEFLAANAADRSASRRAQRIAQSIGPREVPLRTTETAYFIQHHDEINADVWRRKAVGSKANCKACHPDAERGDFAERAIRIPL